MEKLAGRTQEIWKEIKKQPKDIWFFYLFLLTFTLGVRKVILYFPIKRAFNEYAGVYVYASDIFLCSTILVWIMSILYNKITKVSSSRIAISDVIHRKDILEKYETEVDQKLSTRYCCFYRAILSKLRSVALASLSLIVPRGTIKNYLHRKMFHVEQFGINDDKKCSTNLRQGFGGQAWNNFKLAWNTRGVFLIPLLLVIWSFATVAWSENQLISFYKSARFLGLYLLFIYVSIRFVPYLMRYLCNCSTWNNLGINNEKNVPRGTSLNKMFHVEQLLDARLVMGVYFKAILLGFILIMLVDHYFWDIWQGQVLFWLVCGLLAGIGFKHSNSNKCSTWNNLSNNSSEIVPRGTILVDETLCISNVNNKNVPRGTFNIAGLFFLAIIFVGISQSLFGIVQFVTQHSLGLFWLKESLIWPDIAGVAKIIVNYQPFIRAYGLFPHPNILGGFLFFSIMVTLLYIKLFHVEQFNEQNIEKYSTLLRQGFGGQAWNNLNNSRKASENILPSYAKASAGKRGTFWSSFWKNWLNLGNIINLALLIQIFGILLSFSKSAILALMVAFICMNVPRGTISYLRGTRKFDDLDSKKSGAGDFENCSTWNNFSGKIFKMLHPEESNNVPRGTLLDYGAGVEHVRVVISKIALFVGFILIVFVSLTYFKFDFKTFFVKSLEERGLFLSISERIISESPIIGFGTGQFVFEAERLFPNLAIWQYQPVHNVFLLIWSEWGIIGLVLFIVFLWKLFYMNVPRGTILRKHLLPPAGRLISKGEGGGAASNLTNRLFYCLIYNRTSEMWFFVV